MTLFFLLQEMVGTGLPDALHSILIIWPWVTSKLPSWDTWWIRAGTETQKKGITYKIRIFNYLNLIYRMENKKKLTEHF